MDTISSSGNPSDDKGLSVVGCDLPRYGRDLHGIGGLHRVDERETAAISYARGGADKLGNTNGQP